MGTRSSLLPSVRGNVAQDIYIITAALVKRLSRVLQGKRVKTGNGLLRFGMRFWHDFWRSLGIQNVDDYRKIDGKCNKKSSEVLNGKRLAEGLRHGLHRLKIGMHIIRCSYKVCAD